MTFKRHSIKNIIAGFTIRGEDKAGSGAFGASRGKRKHEGLDILTTLGEPVYAPFNLKFLRIAYPYADKSYSGALYESDIFKLKIFYMKPIDETSFKKGDVIGYSENISLKYPDAQTHIHLELRDKITGKMLNPEKYV